MTCINCGANIQPGISRCPKCDSKVATSDNVDNSDSFSVLKQSGSQRMSNDAYPPGSYELDYTPISAWGYVGYNFLFAIPIAGFIVMLVFACGGTRRAAVRSYARSIFCMMLIMAAIFGTFALLIKLGVFMSWKHFFRL